MRIWFVIVLSMDVAQSAAFIQSMSYDTGFVEYDEFPRTASPVWILGTQYSTLYDMDNMKHDILSRPWFTYRRGFSAIGGTGPICDTGWGCMLRCGQMMLAQALIHHHIGRDWRWYADRYHPKYHEILRMFLDKKACCYSIHQIASMGVSEGKAISEWFGPNTIAQVLKKLCVYDEWTNLELHIALDNTVIINDIKSACRQQCKDCAGRAASQRKRGRGQHALSADHQWTPAHADVCNGHVAGKACEECRWKPLLLVIPLRLGLSELNTVYSKALKVCLELHQSVGIIGGRPNHAHWFIGYVDDEMVYLDPHTTQPYVDVTEPRESDASYHCPNAWRMKVTDLDPSIAVGFFCGTEADFDDLCHSIQKQLIAKQHTPMFELLRERLMTFGTRTTTVAAATVELSGLDRQYDTDEEFELL